MPTHPVETERSLWHRLAHRASRAIDGQTLRQTWPLLALTPALLLVVSVGLLIQAIGQIVVSNSARWERAQQSAVINLGRYRESCDPAHFQAYQADMGVLKNFETARDALFAPAPDLATARAAYERLGLTRGESLLMVQVLPRLQSNAMHSQASTIWLQARAGAREMDLHAQQLQASVLRDCTDQRTHGDAFARVLAVHDRFGPLRRSFDATTSRARWRLSMVLLCGMVLLALPITLAGYLLTARLQRRASVAAQALADELALRRSALQSLRTTLAQIEGSEGLPPAQAAMQPQDEIRLTAQALARVGAQQREINERLQAVLTLTPDGFVSFDQQQCIGLASPALHRLTGLDTARLQGQTAADFFAQLHALCRPGTPMPSLLALQARAGAAPMTLDLATRPPRTLSLELCDGTHPLVRHVLCLRDVTHQREVERLKSEFITVAAHELRTPMTIIYGYAEMMMRQQLQDTTRQELQTVIHRQCRLMMSIMDDLMDLGRLEAHPGQALTVAPVDLGALLRATAATLPLPPGRQPPRAHDDAPWPEARVAGNADHLVRLINNVLGNAYKYSPAGTVVEIGLARRPTAGGVDEICISVADQGIGMTPEQLARVGERFYRADTSGHIPGTGLGMSIVGEIARLHGGHVNLQSTPGEGTRVDICLPALPPAGVAPDVGSAAPPPDISR